VRDVLPGEKPVALDLSTERGLAALDICVRRPDGTLEDVLEDNGGALTNVVGMALRLIAVVKAGVGRFLALDEADCWIAPERVPAFYRVLPRPIRRPGSKDRNHGYVVDTAVDRHHRDRRYACASLIEYLDAGGPARRTGQLPALLPRKRERDRVNKPALVHSETTIGGVT